MLSLSSPNEKPRMCVLAEGRCAGFPWAQAGGSSHFLGTLSQGICCLWSLTVCGHLAWALGPECICPGWAFHAQKGTWWVE